MVLTFFIETLRGWFSRFLEVPWWYANPSNEYNNFICQFFVHQNYIKRVRQINVNFLPIKTASKKYIEMTGKFGDNISSRYQRNIDIKMTSILGDVSIGFALYILYAGRLGLNYSNVYLTEVMLPWCNGCCYCTNLFN